jgi:hypothetical protein
MGAMLSKTNSFLGRLSLKPIEGREAVLDVLKDVEEDNEIISPTCNQYPFENGAS